MTRPCECGLGLRPRRLFGFAVEPMGGAPCFFSGSITRGAAGSRPPIASPASRRPATARYKGGRNLTSRQKRRRRMSWKGR
jgi:hypothetical protein